MPHREGRVRRLAAVCRSTSDEHVVCLPDEGSEVNFFRNRLMRVGSLDVYRCVTRRVRILERLFQSSRADKDNLKPALNLHKMFREGYLST